MLFSFASYWSRRWRTLSWPITGRDKGKLAKSRLISDTQWKIARYFWVEAVVWISQNNNEDRVDITVFFFLHFRRRFNILWCECWLWGNGIRLVIGGFGKNFELPFARRIRTFKHRCPSPRLDESKRLFPELKFMKASRVMWRGVKSREELLRILIRYME